VAVAARSGFRTDVPRDAEAIQVPTGWIADRNPSACRGLTCVRRLRAVLRPRRAGPLWSACRLPSVCRSAACSRTVGAARAPADRETGELHLSQRFLSRRRNCAPTSRSRRGVAAECLPQALPASRGRSLPRAHARTRASPATRRLEADARLDDAEHVHAPLRHLRNAETVKQRRRLLRDVVAGRLSVVTPSQNRRLRLPRPRVLRRRAQGRAEALAPDHSLVAHPIRSRATRIRPLSASAM
jgi:hypothetical protein